MTSALDYPRMGLPSLGEDALVAAHGGLPTARVERCACGSAIAAMDDERAITTAVQVHQQTAVHRAWREGEGF